MHRPAGMSAVIFWAWVCSVHLPVATSWSCTLSMLGSSDQTRNLSLVQTTLLCSPDEGDVGTLMPVGFDGRLPRRCRGVDVLPLPADHQNTLLYFTSTNITFTEVQVNDVHAGDLQDILEFDSCPELVFNNFSSSGCQADIQIVHVKNSAVNVSGSSFRNAQARGLGVIDSATTISDTVFENLECPRADQDGGALYVDNSGGGKLLHVQTSDFTNNTANSSKGGAVYMKCATCQFEGVRFLNNTSRGNGGAVLLAKGQSYVKATFDSCFFANNTAGFNGAVYVLPSVDEASFINCTLTGNLAYQGGALSFWAVTNVLVDSCKFVQNYVRSPNGNPGAGAALFVDGYVEQATTLYVLNSTFSHSNGSDSPGFAAVYITRCNCIGIIDSKFEDNAGIGLFIDQTQGNCEREDGSLPHQPLFNLSAIDGNEDGFLNKHIQKSILGKSTSVDIRRTTFSRNVDSTLSQPATQRLVDSYRGGAALNIRGTQNIMLVGLQFEGNKALQGGAMLLDSCTAAVVWSGTFTNNTAIREGGGIATLNNMHTGQIFLGNVTAMGNAAATGGFLYGTDRSSISIANSSTFDGNTASINGGAIACVDCAALTLFELRMSSNKASSFGGALYAEASMAVQSTDVQYIGNRATVGGGAYIAGVGTRVVSQSNITNSTFYMNSASESSFGVVRGGGGALYLNGGVTLVNGNTFRQNNASGFGGALVYVQKCFPPGVELQQPENEYMWDGFEPQIVNGCSTVRALGATNTFERNHADMAGGAVYATEKAGLSLTCSKGLSWDDARGCQPPDWAGNMAGVLDSQGGLSPLEDMLGYGNELAYAPHFISLDGPREVMYTSNGTNIVDFQLRATDIVGQVVSAGVSNAPPVGVTPLRAMVNISTFSSTSGDKESSVLTLRLTGGTTGIADFRGLINVPDLVVSAVPGLYNLSVTLPDFPLVPAAWKTLQVQNCLLGQVTQDDNTTCRVCGNSTFSLDPSRPSCDRCPAGAFCYGADAFIPPEHSWHSGPNSTTIVSCPHAEACEGPRAALLACKEDRDSCNMTPSMTADDPNAYMFKMCSQGYYGPLCSLCLLRNAPEGQQPYGRGGPLECKPCRHKVTIIIAYTASTVLVMLWLTYIIHVTLGENEEDAQGIRQGPRVSEFLKALQLWLQYLTLLAGVNMPAPYALNWLFSAANYAFSAVIGGSFSLDCLLSGQRNTALQSILLHLALPLLVLAAMFVIQAIWWAHTCKQASPQQSSPRQTQARLLSKTSWRRLLLWQTKAAELQSRMIVTLLSVLFYYYPSLLTTILSLFACYHIDRELPADDELYPRYAQARHKHGYWVPDMSIKCFTGWHKGISLGMGIPLVPLGCIIIPLLPCLLLLRSRRQLDTPHVKRRWGFLYCNYRHRFWYWESVVLVQTLGLAAAQVFATAVGAFFQLTIMIFILVVGSLALAHLHPFDQEGPQTVQVLALGIVTATALGCLMFLDRDNLASSVGLRAMAVLLVILNAAFIALVAWLVFKHGKRYTTAFLRQAGAIGRAALRLTKAPLSQCKLGKAPFSSCKAPFGERARQLNASSSIPSGDVAMPVRTSRAESMQPMLSERMLSVPISSRSSMSLDNSHH